MENRPTVFQINTIDNVATALTPVSAGAEAVILGDRTPDIAKANSARASENQNSTQDSTRNGKQIGETHDRILAVEAIPTGHKIALRDIAPEEDIVKYGVVIGQATAAIPKGSWVHLHVMRSLYDERSGHLDTVTGAPKDTKYE